MINLEGRVGAVKLVFGAASALELVDTFSRERCLGYALKLEQLLFAWEQVLLLLLEEEGTVVQTLNEVA